MTSRAEFWYVFGLAAISWMITTASLASATWQTLERGSFDVGGQPLVLSGRLA